VRLRRDHRRAPAEALDVDPVRDLEHVRHVVADQDHREPAVADRERDDRQQQDGERSQDRPGVQDVLDAQAQ
jgi:hypothetical protein